MGKILCYRCELPLDPEDIVYPPYSLQYHANEGCCIAALREALAESKRQRIADVRQFLKLSSSNDE